MRRLRSVLPVVFTVTGACSHRPVDRLYQPAAYYPVQPATACSDSAPHLLPPFRVSDTLSLSRNLVAYERDAWLARRVPGGWAAGPWPAGSRVAVIWMRDATQKAAAVAALKAIRVPNATYGPLGVDSVVVVDVQWDAAELYDWEYYFLHSPGRARVPAGGLGFNTVGIDGRQGRIVFGMEHLEQIPALAEWLGALGAPCNLVVARQSGPVYLLGSVVTLQRANVGR